MLERAFCIPSTDKDVQEFLDELTKIFQEEPAAQDRDELAIRLACEEAIVNAHKHGNQQDPTKNITVQLELYQHGCEIMIGDEGVGFCMSKVPDPRNEDRLEVPSGRGLLLMIHYSEKVTWNDAHNEVTMKFRYGQKSSNKEIVFESSNAGGISV